MENEENAAIEREEATLATEAKQPERKPLLGPGRFKLLARAQMHGDVKEPGYVFTLEDGELGPHRTVIHGHDRIDVTADDQRIQGKMTDVPLYEPYDDGDANTDVEGEHGYPVAAAAIEKRDEEAADATAAAEERADGAPLREELVNYGDAPSSQERRED